LKHHIQPEDWHTLFHCGFPFYPPLLFIQEGEGMADQFFSYFFRDAEFCHFNGGPEVYQRSLASQKVLHQVISLFLGQHTGSIRFPEFRCIQGEGGISPGD